MGHCKPLPWPCPHTLLVISLSVPAGRAGLGPAARWVTGWVYHRKQVPAIPMSSLLAGCGGEPHSGTHQTTCYAVPSPSEWVALGLCLAPRLWCLADQPACSLHPFLSLGLCNPGSSSAPPLEILHGGKQIVLFNLCGGGVGRAGLERLSAFLSVGQSQQLGTWVSFPCSCFLQGPFPHQYGRGCQLAPRSLP